MIKNSRSFIGPQKGRWLRRLGIFLLLCGVLLWIRQTLDDPTAFPINHVVIKGQYAHVSKTALQHAILPYLEAGFFFVDVKGVQQNLLKFPWIEKARVERVWPDKIVVLLAEQIPVAIWNNESVFNVQGKLFSPKDESSLVLPLLSGPTGESEKIFNNYLKMQAALKSFGLEVKKVEVSPGIDYRVELKDGMILQLGKTNVVEHLQQFTKVYQQVFNDPDRSAKAVDLRYSSGMAIQWKANKKAS